MKRALFYLSMLIGLLAVLPIGAHPYRPADIPNVQMQDRTRYVSNPDGVLSNEAVAQIDRICDSLRKARVAEVAVVAVREIASDDLFSFAIELFSTWGVGRSDGDNGLGVLLVESAREIRFVTGDGLEGVLSDALCKRIQQQRMVPYFRRGDYSGGMVAGIEAVAQVLQGGEPLAAETTDEAEWWIFLLWAIGLPLLILGIMWYMALRCPHCNRPTLKLQDQQVTTSATFRLTLYTYVCSHCGRVVKREKNEYIHSDSNNHRGGMGGPFIGGFGGGRGFGGGSFGGGFGGGHFGGGGAGSRW